jgi:hypothetical protein
MVHYHQILPEGLGARLLDFVSKPLGWLALHGVNYNPTEAPLDTELEPVTDWPQFDDMGAYLERE